MPRRLCLLIIAVTTVLTLLGARPAAADPAPLPTGTDVDYQLGGPADVPARVGIVVRDRTVEPLAGKYNVCYVNAFQTQPDAKAFWRDRWGLVLKRNGKPVVDGAWGEWLLDIRTPAKRERLARIVGRWTAGCARDGFDAVEFDNLDSYSRSHGLLKPRHAAAFSRLINRSVHEAGLIAGQKNRGGWDGRKVGFDFAVAEECGRYGECRSYTRVYGDQVLAIEYRRQDFRQACTAVGDRIPVVLRDRDVTPGGVRKYC